MGIRVSDILVDCNDRSDPVDHGTPFYFTKWSLFLIYLYGTLYKFNTPFIPPIRKKTREPLSFVTHLFYRNRYIKLLICFFFEKWHFLDICFTFDMQKFFHQVMWKIIFVVLVYIFRFMKRYMTSLHILRSL